MIVKVSVYIAASLDGFIARKNGDLDWLPTGNEGDEDFGYAKFMSTIDHIVMGRNTAEYQKAVRLLDDLIDTVGEDENHPLASLMEILGLLIEKYEDEHVQEITEI